MYKSFDSFARKHRLSHGTFSWPLAAVPPECVLLGPSLRVFFSLGNWYVIERTPRKNKTQWGLTRVFATCPFLGGILDITFTYVYGLKRMGFSIARFKADMWHDALDTKVSGDMFFFQIFPLEGSSQDF